MKHLATRAFAALMLLAVGSGARASLDVTLDSWTPVGSNTLFSYSISSALNDVIRPGDFFRIYDFGGLVNGSIVNPAGWTVAVQLTTPAPPPNVLLSYGDDPTIPNLIFTRTDTDISGPVTISGFNAETSTYAGKFVFKDFAARIGTVSGGNADSVGTNAVAPNIAAVPEPGAYAMLAGMLVPAGLFLLRRRRA